MWIGLDDHWIRIATVPAIALGGARTLAPSRGRRIERTVTRYGGVPWSIAPVGHAYYLSATGSEPGTMLDDDEALTFELEAQPDDPHGATHQRDAADHRRQGSRHV